MHCGYVWNIEQIGAINKDIKKWLEEICDCVAETIARYNELPL